MTDEPTPATGPEIHYCVTCAEPAMFGFGAPGVPVQPTEAWYCGEHRHEGERRWAARYGLLRRD